MKPVSRRKMEVAIEADLRAREYVAIEQMQKATTFEEYQVACNKLNTIDLHLECIKNRKAIRGHIVDKTIGRRWNAAAREGVVRKAYA